MRMTYVPLIWATFACASAQPSGTKATDPAPEVVRIADVVWEQLNPARGDKSPKAADLWGDRKAAGPTGFLVRFVDGFSSPPHIHNVTYRGVVISGLVHNADPAAKEVWMPPGSYWTQPKGQSHITSAKGSDVMVYVEIDEGPYLVRPIDQAFETEEVPINTDASKVEPATALWGTAPAGPGGTIIDIAPGTTKTVSSAAPFRVIIVQGRTTSLDPGSYIGSKGAAVDLTCEAEATCRIYAHGKGTLELRPSGI